MFDKTVITKDTLELHLAEATVSLLAMARDMTWNTISDSCLYFIANYQEVAGIGRIEKTRKFRSDKTEPQYLANVMPQLLTLYSKLCDINLFIYEASKALTIIEIEYNPKSALDHDHWKAVENNPPTLHCKVALPFYYHFNGKKKFDINWQNNSLSYKINSFWAKFKYRFYRAIGRDRYAILTK